MRQSEQVGSDDVLRVFDSLEEPCEPLTASELAAALGATDDAVREVLPELVSREQLETKRFESGDRVWWRPSRATDGSTEDTTSHSTDTFLERVLDVSPVGITVVDPSGIISFANAHAAETMGTTREALVGHSYKPREWNVTDDDGTPISADEYAITRVLRTGEPEFGFEHWIEQPDGTEQWLSSSSVPVRGDDGELEYVVTGFVDVTALKEREEKLTSDHLRLLEIRAHHSAVPPSFREVSSEEIRIDVDSVVALPDGTTVQYMSTADIPVTEFIIGIREVPHYLDARLLSTKGGRTHIEALAESATVSAVFQSLGGRARAVIVDADEVRFLGEIPGDVDPRDAVDGVRNFHPEAELASQDLVYSPRVLQHVVADALTDRQFATLEAAFYGGYFDTPRTSTGDELAVHFDVTRQTFNQHLRKAERAVFQHLFEKSAEDAR